MLYRALQPDVCLDGEGYPYHQNGHKSCQKCFQVYSIIIKKLQANFISFSFSVSQVSASIRGTTWYYTPSKPSQIAFRQALYLKLLVVLGLLWVLEGTHALITYFDPHGDEEGTFSFYFFKIVDTLNLLRGVFIFIIFVCKRKVWESINSYRWGQN